MGHYDSCYDYDRNSDYVSKMKVTHLKDSTYQVVESYLQDNILFQGSLSDCEAFIRLTEGGYLD